MSGPAFIIALFGSVAYFGQERGNIEALAALRDQGCDVLCLVRPELWASTIREALTARGLRWRTAPYINAWRPNQRFSFVTHNVLAFPIANLIFLSVIAKFKPTHIYAFNVLYVFNFLLAIALVRLPMVFRAGDAPPQHNAFFRWLWSWLSGRTERFVAISQFIKDALVATNIPANRIAVIYNKPPARIVGDNTDRLPAGFESPELFRVLYVGQISAHKGVPTLIEAFRQVASNFPQARLLLAGRISDWSGDAWARALRDKIYHDEALKERVAFLGHVEDVTTLYHACQIHVCPSEFEEPLSNVVMEAKDAARASIVFASGGLPELVEHGVDGMICGEKNASCLAGTLEHYLNNPDLAMRHGLAARSSLRRFELGRFAERWRCIIDETTLRG